MTDKIAIRASGWHRRDGGWIDRVDLYDQRVLEKNVNHLEATVSRIAIAFAPTENFTITRPSSIRRKVEPGAMSSWLSLSNPEEGIYRNASNLGSTGKDRFGLPRSRQLGAPAESTLSPTPLLQAQLGLSRLYRAMSATLLGTAQPPIPGLTARGYWLDQENFTQEIRLQSNDSSARLSWVIGGFYSHAKQRASVHRRLAV
ncbi:MAG: hypothetical protein IPG62_15680 [Sphingomonadales bacterium]|nr:hypothetical protein [Sphingomonadales bacterium]